MEQKKLLTNGNVFKRTDNRWGGVVWYSDEQGERKRKSFSGTTKQEVNRKITDYITAFNESKIASQESKKRLKKSMQSWLELFKFPSVERTTYDRCECTARNQIYPLLGDKTVGDITAADIKALLVRIHSRLARISGTCKGTAKYHYRKSLHLYQPNLLGPRTNVCQR